MVNWRSYSGLPCVSDRVKTVYGFLVFLMLSVRLFCEIHGLTVFSNKHMVNWRSYSGLPCVSDRVKTVYGFLVFLMLSVRLFCEIHGLTVFSNKHIEK